jgi:hypothetical protein
VTAWLGVLAVLGPAPALGEPPASGNLLRNPGAERAKGDGPADWYACYRPGLGAKLWRAADRAKAGEASFAIDGGPPNEEQVSNNWAQRVEDVPRGKAVRVVAYVRTEGAGAVNVCVQAWGEEALVAFVSTPVVRGDQDWTLVQSRAIVVPRATKSLVVRAALTGPGRAWFDDLALIVEDPEPAAPSEDAQAGVDEALARAVPGRIVRASPMAGDCMILGYLPDWDHGNVDNVGLCNSGLERRRGGVRTLLRWPPLSGRDLAPGRRFFVALYVRRAATRGTVPPVQVFEVLEPWPERTSWATMPAYADQASGHAALAPRVGWTLLDVTDLVRARSGDPAHGILLRFANEDRPPSALCTFDFVSREGEGPWAARRPLLLVVEPSRSSPNPRPDRPPVSEEIR